MTPSRSWIVDAACRSCENPELWFPHEPSGHIRPGRKPRTRQSMRAEAICRGCAVRRECLQYALAHNEQYGIWGGMSANERASMKTRKQ